MTSIVKLTKQGNSTGVTLARDVLDEAGLSRGDEVAVTVRAGRIEITRADTPYQQSMDAFRAVGRRYPRTLAKLAK